MLLKAKKGAKRHFKMTHGLFAPCGHRLFCRLKLPHKTKKGSLSHQGFYWCGLPCYGIPYLREGHKAGINSRTYSGWSVSTTTSSDILTGKMMNKVTFLLLSLCSVWTKWSCSSKSYTVPVWQLFIHFRPTKKYAHLSGLTFCHPFFLKLPYKTSSLHWWEP